MSGIEKTINDQESSFNIDIFCRQYEYLETICKEILQRFKEEIEGFKKNSVDCFFVGFEPSSDFIRMRWAYIFGKPNLLQRSPDHVLKIPRELFNDEGKLKKWIDNYIENFNEKK